MNTPRVLLGRNQSYIQVFRRLPSANKYRSVAVHCRCSPLATTDTYDKQLTMNQGSAGTSPMLHSLIKYYSTLPDDHKSPEKATPTSVDTGTKSLSIFQRFKQAYKEHGKVLVGVHVATSVVWFGSFFYIASSGVDVVGILLRLGVSDWLLEPLRDSSLGHAAVAYLMYKLATPARYTVTLGGTSIAIKQLKKQGHIQQPDVKMRELMREGAHNAKDRLEDRVGDVRDRVEERYSEAKDKYSERRQKREDEHSERDKPRDKSSKNKI